MAKKKIKDYWFSVLMFMLSCIFVIGTLMIILFGSYDLLDVYSKSAVACILSLHCIFIGLLDLPEKKKKESSDKPKYVLLSGRSSCKSVMFINHYNESKALNLIKEKGLSLIHKSLIISSKSYEEYRQEFQIARSREFKNEYFYTRNEYDLLKEIL